MTNTVPLVFIFKRRLKMKNKDIKAIGTFKDVTSSICKFANARVYFETTVGKIVVATITLNILGACVIKGVELIRKKTS